MQYLIEYLHSEERAADYFRQMRWSEAVCCVYCGSRSIKVLGRCDNGLQHYDCPSCAQERVQQFATFNDWTGSVFEDSKLKPTKWLLVIGLWEMKLNATEIAQAAGKARTDSQTLHQFVGWRDL